ncbi:sugar kinase [bacterium]|nr:MAG: sugar kinase [bacterium]
MGRALGVRDYGAGEPGRWIATVNPEAVPCRPMSPVVVAGHLCLDIIPALPTLAGFEPGRLVEAGKVTLATGGAVSNVGGSLHALGAPVRLVGKVGDDPFADVVRRLLNERELGERLTVAPGESTSYTVVINIVGQDRMFLHHPGCNDTFGPEDVPAESLEGAGHLHFGYPPLMARMYGDAGETLAATLGQAKAAGLTVSLDTSLPDREAASGRAPWTEILTKALAQTDVFLPSDDEIAFMLGGEARPDEDRVRELARWCLDRGPKVVGIKRGDRGLYLTDGAVEVWEPCRRVTVAGTTGSGDATIAGFLFGWLQGRPLAECARSATATGAACCERPDATSGVPSWSILSARLAAGWETC